MKKIISKVKNNLLLVIICAIMFSAIGAVAATLISSSEVSYNNANSGSSATTVKGALDELYNMAQNCASGTTTGSSTAYYVYGFPYSSLATTDYNNVKDKNGNKRKIFLRYQNGKISVCLIYNNKLECFDYGNWEYESLHAMQVFNGNCTGNSDMYCGGTTNVGDVNARISVRNSTVQVSEKYDSGTLFCSLNAYGTGQYFSCTDVNN